MYSHSWFSFNDRLIRLDSSVSGLIALTRRYLCRNICNVWFRRTISNVAIDTTWVWKKIRQSTAPSQLARHILFVKVEKLCDLKHFPNEATQMFLFVYLTTLSAVQATYNRCICYILWDYFSSSLVSDIVLKCFHL